MHNWTLCFTLRLIFSTSKNAGSLYGVMGFYKWQVKVVWFLKIFISPKYRVSQNIWCSAHVTVFSIHVCLWFIPHMKEVAYKFRLIESMGITVMSHVSYCVNALQRVVVMEHSVETEDWMLMKNVMLDIRLKMI